MSRNGLPSLGTPPPVSGGDTLPPVGLGFPLPISVPLPFLRPRKTGNHSDVPGSRFGMQIWKLFFSADTHDSGFHSSRHGQLCQKAVRKGHLICKVTNPRIQTGHPWQGEEEAVCLSFLGDQKIGRLWGLQVPYCTLIPPQGGAGGVRGEVASSFSQLPVETVSQ